MATELFKDGESILVDPARIQAHVAQGWSFDDPSAPPVPRLEVNYPPHINPNAMSEAELQDAILEEMGIEVKHPEPVKRRGRPRKKAA
jgi:hypothetical protein